MKRHHISPASIRIFFLLFVFIIGSPTTAHALDGVYDPDFYSGNNILFYDPSGGGAACSATPSVTTNIDIPTLTGKDNEEKIWNFLTGQAGLSPEQAAGVMGNISQESGFKPDLVENTSRAEKGYGIVQWTFGRRTDLENAAKEKGVEPSDLGFQLAYMVQESQSRKVSSQAAAQGYGSTSDNEWDTLKKQKTPKDAAVFWHASFEISADTAAQIGERVTDAATILGKYGNLPAGSKNLDGSAVNAACGFAGGNLQQTVLAYAWPEYHEADYLEMKPAYEEAVKKGQADGKNVGGGEHPGIDCAGFVNLLITDSGFDPAYNYDGKGNDAAGATGEAQHRTWMQENWSYIGRGGSAEVDVAKLQPGDVGVSRADASPRVQHIYVYVGQINGFGNVFASASYMLWRTPMAAGDFENSANPDYDWYRKK